MPTGFPDKGFYTVCLASEDIGDETVEDTSTNYESYDEAMEAAETLTEETERGVYIYEAAAFKIGRKKKEEMILFWWNKVYANALEEVPRGRGHGYYRSDAQEWSFVRYEPDPDFSETAEDEEDTEEPEEEYVTTSCESCGKVIPQYEAQVYNTEIETGRSSGSSRFGRSSSRRTSSKGSSYTSGSSSSNSSGRTYYKTVYMTLCPDCYKQRSREDWIWLILKWGFYAIVGAIILFVANRR